MQLAPAGFEVDVAEGLQSGDFHFRETDEYAAVAGESLQIYMALTVEIRAHPLNLEIGHITHSAAERTLVRTWPAEVKSLDKTSLRKHLAGSADDLTQTNVRGEYTDDVRAAGYPDERLVFVGFELTPGVDVEQFWMQRPLVKVEGKFIDSNINLR